ncbi:acyltransferase [Vicingus serpentipes]|uniref:Acyltransferase n=1 Tax=Vicingus serpentipes TaxID=1926625 RepID=A0A5C6RMS7_9FLAO|nr:acyltransferase [Vicingus serpentipes]TXB63708.1 acyltransferase [Vicingus serpentipes]
MSPIKKEINWINNIRVIACFLVIIAHIGINNNIFDKFLFLISKVGVPFFLIISGYLTLTIKNDTQNIINRLKRLVIPFIFWSIFYALFSFYNNQLDLKQTLYAIALIPFQSTASHMWYMYTIIGLTLFNPIISAWLVKVEIKPIFFYLLLWVLTLCYPYISYLINSINMSSNEGLLSLFYFSGYLGYYVLGYAIKRSQDIISNKLILFLLLLIPIIATYLLNTYTSVGLLSTRYLTINIFCLSLFAFLLIKNIDLKSEAFNKIISKVSKNSFGIYLIHKFILYYTEQDFFIYKYLNDFFLTKIFIAIITMTVSYLIIELISKLPFKKYIIG